jgi:hypothetical protein
MQMKNNILIVSCLILSITSCTLERKITTKKSIHNPKIEVVESKVYVKPIVADLKIGAEKKFVDYTADLKIPLAEIQNNAMNLFLITHNCDYIVDPIYTEVTTIDNSKLNSITMKVTGYPATYDRIYQVESLPNSISQASQINLPIKRADFISEFKENTSGSSLGLEFIPLGSSILFQLDYSKSLDGLHYYFSSEFKELSNDKEVDVEVVFSQPGFGTQSFSSPAVQYSNYSFGVFKNKEINNHIKCRAMFGFNSANTYFLNRLVYDESAFIGLRTLGLRMGTSIQYEVLQGIYAIGRANADLTLKSAAIQDGDINAEISNLNTSNSGLYKLGFGLGLRFEF